MTKLRNFANAREVMDKDPSLLDELENYMNIEEKNAFTLLQRKAEEYVIPIVSKDALVIGEDAVRRIGRDIESLYNKVLERLKVENKSKEEK